MCDGWEAVFVYVISHSSVTYQSSVITQSSRVIRITVFTKKSEKLIQILLHFFAPVDACSATINDYELITGSKSAQ